MSSRSRKPRVVSTPVGAPRRWTIAFETRVVPWKIDDTSRSVAPTSSSDAMTPFDSRS
jgi:hypothetical protein